MFFDYLSHFKIQKLSSPLSLNKKELVADKNKKLFVNENVNLKENDFNSFFEAGKQNNIFKEYFDVNRGMNSFKKILNDSQNLMYKDLNLKPMSFYFFDFKQKRPFRYNSLSKFYYKTSDLKRMSKLEYLSDTNLSFLLNGALNNNWYKQKCYLKFQKRMPPEYYLYKHTNVFEQQAGVLDNFFFFNRRLRKFTKYFFFLFENFFFLKRTILVNSLKVERNTFDFLQINPFQNFLYYGLKVTNITFQNIRRFSNKIYLSKLRAKYKGLPKGLRRAPDVNRLVGRKLNYFHEGKKEENKHRYNPHKQSLGKMLKNVHNNNKYDYRKLTFNLKEMLKYEHARVNKQYTSLNKFKSDHVFNASDSLLNFMEDKEDLKQKGLLANMFSISNIYKNYRNLASRIFRKRNITIRNRRFSRQYQSLLKKTFNNLKSGSLNIGDSDRFFYFMKRKGGLLEDVSLNNFLETIQADRGAFFLNKDSLKTSLLSDFSEFFGKSYTSSIVKTKRNVTNRLGNLNVSFYNKFYNKNIGVSNLLYKRNFLLKKSFVSKSNKSSFEVSSLIGLKSDSVLKNLNEDASGISFTNFNILFKFVLENILVYFENENNFNNGLSKGDLLLVNFLKIILKMELITDLTYSNIKNLIILDKVLFEKLIKNLVIFLYTTGHGFYMSNMLLNYYKAEGQVYTNNVHKNLINSLSDLKKLDRFFKKIRGNFENNFLYNLKKFILNKLKFVKKISTGYLNILRKRRLKKLKRKNKKLIIKGLLTKVLNKKVNKRFSRKGLLLRSNSKYISLFSKIKTDSLTRNLLRNFYKRQLKAKLRLKSWFVKKGSTFGGSIVLKNRLKRRNTYLVLNDLDFKNTKSSIHLKVTQVLNNFRQIKLLKRKINSLFKGPKGKNLVFLIRRFRRMMFFIKHSSKINTKDKIKLIKLLKLRFYSHYINYSYLRNRKSKPMGVQTNYSEKKLKLFNLLQSLHFKKSLVKEDFRPSLKSKIRLLLKRKRKLTKLFRKKLKKNSQMVFLSSKFKLNRLVKLPLIKSKSNLKFKAKFNKYKNNKKKKYLKKKFKKKKFSFNYNYGLANLKGIRLYKKGLYINRKHILKNLINNLYLSRLHRLVKSNLVVGLKKQGLFGFKKKKLNLKKNKTKFKNKINRKILLKNKGNICDLRSGFYGSLNKILGLQKFNVNNALKLNRFLLSCVFSNKKLKSKFRSNNINKLVVGDLKKLSIKQKLLNKIKNKQKYFNKINRITKKVNTRKALKINSKVLNYRLLLNKFVGNKFSLKKSFEEKNISRELVYNSLSIQSYRGLLRMVELKLLRLLEQEDSFLSSGITKEDPSYIYFKQKFKMFTENISLFLKNYLINFNYDRFFFKVKRRYLRSKLKNTFKSIAVDNTSTVKMDKFLNKTLLGSLDSMGGISLTKKQLSKFYALFKIPFLLKKNRHRSKRLARVILKLKKINKTKSKHLFDKSRLKNIHLKRKKPRRKKLLLSKRYFTLFNKNKIKSVFKGKGSLIKNKFNLKKLRNRYTSLEGMFILKNNKSGLDVLKLNSFLNYKKFLVAKKKYFMYFLNKRIKSRFNLNLSRTSGKKNGYKIFAKYNTTGSSLDFRNNFDLDKILSYKNYFKKKTVKPLGLDPKDSLIKSTLSDILKTVISKPLSKLKTVLKPRRFKNELRTTKVKFLKSFFQYYRYRLSLLKNTFSVVPFKLTKNYVKNKYLVSDYWAVRKNMIVGMHKFSHNVFNNIAFNRKISLNFKGIRSKFAMKFMGKHYLKNRKYSLLKADLKSKKSSFKKNYLRRELSSKVSLGLKRLKAYLENSFKRSYYFNMYLNNKNIGLDDLNNTFLSVKNNLLSDFIKGRFIKSYHKYNNFKSVCQNFGSFLLKGGRNILSAVYNKDPFLIKKLFNNSHLSLNTSVVDTINTRHLHLKRNGLLLTNVVSEFLKKNYDTFKRGVNLKQRFFFDLLFVKYKTIFDRFNFVKNFEEDHPLVTPTSRSRFIFNRSHVLAYRNRLNKFDFMRSSKKKNSRKKLSFLSNLFEKSSYPSVDFNLNLITKLYSLKKIKKNIYLDKIVSLYVYNNLIKKIYFKVIISFLYKQKEISLRKTAFSKNFVNLFNSSLDFRKGSGSLALSKKNEMFNFFFMINDVGSQSIIRNSSDKRSVFNKLFSIYGSTLLKLKALNSSSNDNVFDERVNNLEKHRLALFSNMLYFNKILSKSVKLSSRLNIIQKQYKSLNFKLVPKKFDMFDFLRNRDSNNELRLRFLRKNFYDKSILLAKSYSNFELFNVGMNVNYNKFLKTFLVKDFGTDSDLFLNFLKNYINVLQTKMLLKIKSLKILSNNKLLTYFKTILNDSSLSHLYKLSRIAGVSLMGYQNNRSYKKLSHSGTSNASDMFLKKIFKKKSLYSMFRRFLKKNSTISQKSKNVSFILRSRLKNLFSSKGDLKYFSKNLKKYIGDKMAFNFIKPISYKFMSKLSRRLLNSKRKMLSTNSLFKRLRVLLNKKSGKTKRCLKKKVKITRLKFLMKKRHGFDWSVGFKSLFKKLKIKRLLLRSYARLKLKHIVLLKKEIKNKSLKKKMLSKYKGSFNKFQGSLLKSRMKDNSHLNNNYVMKIYARCNSSGSFYGYDSLFIKNLLETSFIALGGFNKTYALLNSEYISVKNYFKRYKKLSKLFYDITVNRNFFFDSLNFNKTIFFKFLNKYSNLNLNNDLINGESTFNNFNPMLNQVDSLGKSSVNYSLVSPYLKVNLKKNILNSLNGFGISHTQNNYLNIKKNFLGRSSFKLDRFSKKTKIFGRNLSLNKSKVLFSNKYRVLLSYNVKKLLFKLLRNKSYFTRKFKKLGYNFFMKWSLKNKMLNDNYSFAKLQTNFSLFSTKKRYYRMLNSYLTMKKGLLESKLGYVTNIGCSADRLLDTLNSSFIKFIFNKSRLGLNFSKKGSSVLLNNFKLGLKYNNNEAISSTSLGLRDIFFDFNKILMNKNPRSVVGRKNSELVLLNLKKNLLIYLKNIIKYKTNLNLLEKDLFIKNKTENIGLYIKNKVSQDSSINACFNKINYRYLKFLQLSEIQLKNLNLNNFYENKSFKNLNITYNYNTGSDVNLFKFLEKMYGFSTFTSDLKNNLYLMKHLNFSDMLSLVFKNNNKGKGVRFQKTLNYIKKMRLTSFEFNSLTSVNEALLFNNINYNLLKKTVKSDKDYSFFGISLGDSSSKLFFKKLKKLNYFSKNIQKVSLVNYFNFYVKNKLVLDLSKRQYNKMFLNQVKPSFSFNNIIFNYVSSFNQVSSLSKFMSSSKINLKIYLEKFDMGLNSIGFKTIKNIIFFKLIGLYKNLYNYISDNVNLNFKSNTGFSKIMEDLDSFNFFNNNINELQVKNLNNKLHFINTTKFTSVYKQLLENKMFFFSNIFIGKSSRGLRKRKQRRLSFFVKRLAKSGQINHELGKLHSRVASNMLLEKYKPLATFKSDFLKKLSLIGKTRIKGVANKLSSSRLTKTSFKDKKIKLSRGKAKGKHGLNNSSVQLLLKKKIELHLRKMALIFKKKGMSKGVFHYLKLFGKGKFIPFISIYFKRHPWLEKILRRLLARRKYKEKFRRKTYRKRRKYLLDKKKKPVLRFYKKNKELPWYKGSYSFRKFGRVFGKYLKNYYSLSGRFLVSLNKQKVRYKFTRKKLASRLLNNRSSFSLSNKDYYELSDLAKFNKNVIYRFYKKFFYVICSSRINNLFLSIVDRKGVLWAKSSNGMLGYTGPKRLTSVATKDNLLYLLKRFVIKLSKKNKNYRSTFFKRKLSFRPSKRTRFYFSKLLSQRKLKGAPKFKIFNILSFKKFIFNFKRIMSSLALKLKSYKSNKGLRFKLAKRYETMFLKHLVRDFIRYKNKRRFMKKRRKLNIFMVVNNFLKSYARTGLMNLGSNKYVKVRRIVSRIKRPFNGCRSRKVRRL